MGLPRIYAGRRRALLWRLVAIGVGQALCGLAIAETIRIALEDLRVGAFAWPSALAPAGVAFAVVLLRILEARDGERLGQDYVMRVRLRILDRHGMRPVRASGRGRLGLTMTRLIGDLGSLRGWVSVGMARGIVASVSALGLIAGLIHLTPRTGTVTAGLIAIFLIVTACVAPALRGSIREARKQRGRLANLVGENLMTRASLRQLGLRSRARKLVRRRSEKLADALIRRVTLSAALRALADGLLPFGIAALAVSALLRGGPVESAIQAVLLIGLIAGCLADLTRCLEERLAFAEGRDRIVQLLGEERIREARNAQALRGTEPIGLRFEGLTVRGLFDGLEGELGKGEWAWVQGASGSGKSTLLAMVARLLDPDRGRFLLGGLRAKRIQLDSLHSAVQWVAPDAPLLRGTLEENLLLGAGETDPAWITSVLEACGLREDDPRLPGGLSTHLEERGENLPQTLRACVALARAVIRRPRLLLVDDPVFDSSEEARGALRAVRELHPMSALVVGRPFPQVRATDPIWRLEHGKLFMTAVDEEIMERGSLPS